jgi:hypothetical protein
VLNRASIALCLAAGLLPVAAATLERLTMPDLVAKSTAIVHGQVTGSSTSFSGNVVYTHYQVNVLEQWKGASQTTADVVVPGGVYNGIRQEYPGAPDLSIGQQYVLFLWTSHKGVTYTMGFTQGVFSLPKDASGQTMAVRAPTTETILEPGTGRPLKDQPIRMPLRKLVSMIQSGGAE